ncbi:uncharacterized protein BO95DRAFT_446749 [Aspergillus brunneoviolaceus CBS 621.78]|uniref:Uncharacterized protein n=1 Tax=Aspergillus brunneoviolaceus CBS 621.78 TaxID=1450534 RepID=A0ACD1FX57_9EURO|nr:hypothetical protein BO95DRAFT_446749 [Aspergillus brunneoviolaceus CBS 621.78]RAH41600.1 hypothetical protein BO95DRAFT_446749 [Aspergillus brunneoviolaceus CBS 621.78]
MHHRHHRISQSTHGLQRPSRYLCHRESLVRTIGPQTTAKASKAGIGISEYVLRPSEVGGHDANHEGHRDMSIQHGHARGRHERLGSLVPSEAKHPGTTSFSHPSIIQVLEIDHLDRAKREPGFLVSAPPGHYSEVNNA